ncbi:MAG: phytanoyl-CoA dioxygenase family protein [Bacteroidota bacterium]
MTKELPDNWLGDPQLRAEFAEKGYALLPQFAEKELAPLRSLYQSLQRGQNDGFFTSMNLEDSDDRRRVDATIKCLLGEKAQELLPGYRPLLGNFTVKAPEGDSELRIHLDWSVLDERHHRTIGIWLPLSDVDEHNGALGILEGSHRVGHTRRGSLVNFVTWDQRFSPSGFLEAVKAQYPARLLCLKAGTAVIYDLSLAHFSVPNRTPQVRLATNLMMIPEEAQPVHYFRESERRIRQMQVDQEFFLTRNMAAPPDLDRYPSIVETLAPGEVIEEQYGTGVVIGEGEYTLDRRLGAPARTLTEAIGRTNRPWWRQLFSRNN